MKEQMGKMKTTEMSFVTAVSRYRTTDHKRNEEITEEPGIIHINN